MQLPKWAIILVVAFSIYVSYQSFHNYSYTKSQRFWLSIGMLIAVLCAVAITVPQPKPVEVGCLTVVIFVVMSSIPVNIHHLGVEHRNQHWFDRLEIPIYFLIGLASQKKGWINLGGNNIKAMRKFLTEITPEHRKRATDLASEVILQISKRKMLKFIDDMNDADIEAIIKAYWLKYKD